MSQPASTRAKSSLMATRHAAPLLAGAALLAALLLVARSGGNAGGGGGVAQWRALPQPPAPPATPPATPRATPRATPSPPPPPATPPPLPPPAASVLVPGVGGLGNVLFQVAAAVLYAERHGYEVVLDSQSAAVNWGTSNLTRDKTRRFHGRPQSYLDSIFATPKLRAAPLSQLRGAGGSRHVTVHNDYTANTFSPPPGFNGTIEILGYCQHYDLFLPILPALPSYLNLAADELASTVLRIRYGLERGQTNNIMLGVRRGLDFSGMTKVQAGSYARALDKLMATAPAPAAWRLFVLADVDPASLDLPGLAARAARKHGHSLEYAAVINEDDLTMIQAGLLCDHFILCESTFHYWITVLRTALVPEAPPRVFVFNDTDLTNRPLAFPNWTRVQY
ncbi:hypothetical protein Rsub_04912 [Raphidocelis subcapitata]|uniref:Uncharacterized protein n=1 Tax=Raphidocelis subcapitata TaxID=307507 RepID=A0A2V0P3M0_9CHLO|nr:hypothetical protein Rsub_04912 [Raphidocelis subcapitata]|eukprot:GBF91807.1 hypothetical protein Rsub_04912 [Raphidocelis subcapitata]